MVSVSQAFEPARDVKPLLKRVLQQAVKRRTENEKGIKEEGTMDIDKLDPDEYSIKLQEIFNYKRYLIVIDDVWTIRAWEAIESMLPKNNRNSRIIVTTRIETVAKACSPVGVTGHYIHHMKPLKLEDSKKLFLSRVFGSVDARYPGVLEDVMDNILKKCGGMPLAIVSIASVLAGYTSSDSKDKWETICKSIGSQMESNPTLEGMRHIVKLSYSHLPYDLKNCMMYLSIFPEDYNINKHRLLDRWIAEGLVPQKRGLTLMEVAESYLDELVSRNMIRPSYGFDGKVESCQVHDMLLEVMVSKSLECNFASLLGGQQYAGMSYDRIRRLSIHAGDGKIGAKQPSNKKKAAAAGHGFEGMDVEHVRSLSVFQLQGDKNLLANLDRFKLLRVLDLEGCEGLTKDHMRYICRLCLLKFLNLKDTGIEEMPLEVGKLEHLQVLDVRGSGLGGLPETLTDLEKLERLEFKSNIGWDIFWKLPKGISNMKALRVVSNSLLGNDIQVAQEIGELKQLQEFCVYIDSYQIKVDDKEILDELATSFSKMYSLRSLNIGEMAWTDILKFLHHLPAPPRLLRYLRMTGEIGGKLPYWIASLTYLGEIVIAWVYLSGDEPFGVLRKLPNLKSIGMERKYYTDDELVARTEHNFPALVNLHMTCNYADDTTPRVYRFEEGAMPKLETLQLEFNHYDKSIEGIKHLRNLREVQLTGKEDNPAVRNALELLMDERGKRPESNRFQVVVKYE
ncbi:hypothetical protein BS78_02G119500 [Paspalum vaginatum]|nr:hypothetical protein BS78_02G119500 [Paspalum vaginatum]